MNGRARCRISGLPADYRGSLAGRDCAWPLGLCDRLVAEPAEGPLRGGELAVVRETAKQALRDHLGDHCDVRSVASRHEECDSLSPLGAL